MNEIKIKGYLRNIEPSHMIGDVEYDKAQLVVRGEDREDIIDIKFKRFSNTYKEDDLVTLTGNVRSYSRVLDSGKNRVQIYVFTYFDKPEEDDSEYLNSVRIDGRICKLEELRTLSNGKSNIHFILANNLIIGESSQKLNSYIPCIAWGNVAKEIAKLAVNSKISVSGRLQSREYKKRLSDKDFEICVAHELYIESVEVIE